MNNVLVNMVSTNVGEEVKKDKNKRNFFEDLFAPFREQCVRGNSCRLSCDNSFDVSH